MKAAVAGLVSGLLGILIARGGLHLYRDYVLVDAIRADMLMKQRTAAPKKLNP